ncbi:MAG: response regulator, partial [Oscillospiraceae bacterium]
MIYKALIVDDESIIRNGILGMPVWNELNISPVGAATGTQGLHLICQEHFDLVITDIRMPEMDGLELISKAREFDKALPFVVLSGHDSFDYAQTAMRYGVKDYLLKPIAPNELSRVIKNIIAECEEAKRKQNKEEIIKHQQEQLADTALERRMRDLLLHIDRATDFSADNFDIQQSFDVLLYLIQAEGKDESFNAVATISNLIRAIRSSTDISADDNLITFTFMDSLILLIPPNSNAAQKALLTLQSALHDNDCRISVAVTGPCAVENISQLYAKALNLIDYKFYYDEFCLLTAE